MRIGVEEARRKEMKNMVKRGVMVAGLITLCGGLYSPAQDDPQTYILDTGTVSMQRLGAAAITNRAAWTRLDEDVRTHVFQGDAVLVNNRLALVLRRNADGAEVYTVAAGRARYRALAFPAIGREGVRTRLVSLRIVENTPGGVQIDAAFEVGGVQASVGLRLLPGEPLVELRPGAGLTAMKVEAAVRYVVAPNFFGNDMAFSAASVEGARVTLAMEQFFLNLLDEGDSILMGVCEKDGQQAVMRLAGEGAGRRITGMEMELPVGTKAWLAFIEDAGIWTDTPPLWTPPFAARWRIDAFRGGGMALSTAYAASTNAITGAGGACCTAVSGLSVTGTAAVCAAGTCLGYPLERDRTTPVTAYCVRDIMKNTLGVGPCEYVLAQEGLNAATPVSVVEWVRKQFDKKKDLEAADQIRERFGQMREHVQHMQERILAYRQLAGRVQTLAAGAGSLPAVSNTVGQISVIAGRLGEQAQAAPELRRTPAEMAAKIEALSAGIVNLIGKPGSAAECARIGRQIEVIGEEQDRTLANCRLSAKWMIARCRDFSAVQPDAQTILAQIVAEVTAVFNKKG